MGQREAVRYHLSEGGELIEETLAVSTVPVAEERRAESTKLVDQAAHRPDVGRGVVGPVGPNLGTHVVGCADLGLPTYERGRLGCVASVHCFLVRARDRVVRMGEDLP